MYEDDEKQFDEFHKCMSEEMEGHNYIYGDSWKTMPIEKLEERLKTKIKEYELTRHPKKLLSLSNLSMLLFLRLDGLKNYKARKGVDEND